MLVLGWYFIRYEHARRSRRETVVRSARGPRETALLLTSLTGLGIFPIVYIITAMPRFAAYTFRPGQAWLGLFFAVASLLIFQLTHRALGRNWSVMRRRFSRLSSNFRQPRVIAQCDLFAGEPRYMSEMSSGSYGATPLLGAKTRARRDLFPPNT